MGSLCEMLAVLFNPTLIGLEYPGIHQCLVNAISKSDIDIRRRVRERAVGADRARGGVAANFSPPR
jgi:hypothetical protein